MADAVIAPTVTVPVTPPELRREPLIQNNRGPGWLSDAIAGIAEGKTPKWWWVCFVISVVVMTGCFSMIASLISTGVGVAALSGPTLKKYAELLLEILRSNFPSFFLQQPK